MKTHNFKLCNLDTDSISFCKQDGSPFSKEEQVTLLEELNSHFPNKIKWEHDGNFSKVVVLKVKNYILKDEKGKVKIKGSALKSSKIEKALKEFMGELINCLLEDRQTAILSVYHKYIREVYNVKDISRFCSKKTVTDAVLNPGRTAEQKIKDALIGKDIQMGEKYYMYFTNDEEHSLALQENWDMNSPNHNVDILLEKLYKVLIIFENVIDLKQIPKYHLKKQKDKLQEVLNGNS